MWQVSISEWDRLYVVAAGSWIGSTDRWIYNQDIITWEKKRKELNWKTRDHSCGWHPQLFTAKRKIHENTLPNGPNERKRTVPPLFVVINCWHHLIIREIKSTKDRQDLSLAWVYCRKWKEKCVKFKAIVIKESSNGKFRLVLDFFINLSEVNK